MRIAISNIAWDVNEDDAVAALLQTKNIDAIDIAPGKYFPDPVQTNEAAIKRVNQYWRARGIHITGMQGLLFATTGLNLFADQSIQQKMLDRLEAIARIAGQLDAKKLVFGSPKNRDRSHLSDQQTQSIALEFFHQLGDRAAKHGVCFCLEPNPEQYGANFMCDSIDTGEMVAAINHPAIKMQLDTGALTINQESIADIVGKYQSLIGHIHASEPDLHTLGDGGCDHQYIANTLKPNLADLIVTIEMRASDSEPHLNAIERALDLAINAYG